MKRACLRAGALLPFIVLLALACSGRSDRPGGLLLIVIDTLRADRLGSYGYAGAHTPVLDALAARGTRFSQAMTPVPVTLPAVASLLTGRLPFHHGVRDNEHYVLRDGEESLAERFRAAGWRTAAVVGSAILAADRGLDQGFERYDDDFSDPFPVYNPSLEIFADDFAQTQRRADRVTDRALAALAGFGRDPFFLLVHYFDVHSYYDPPPEYAALHPKSRYDGEVSFADAEIGRLLDTVGGRKDVLVVIVADHGEGLGEHGETEHGFLLYQSTLHVPILVAGPGVPGGFVRDDPVSLVDLEPTLASVFRLPAPELPRDGRVLRWQAPEAQGSSLYAETCRTLVSYGWSELRALRQGSIKLIAGPRDEVYDLDADPGEIHPLESGPRAEELAGELAALTGGETREDVLALRGGDVDPERRELLESLGYIAGTDESAPAQKTYPHPADELLRWEAAQKRKALYRRGLTLASHGRFTEAIAAFDSVLAAEPGRADAYYNRGLARRRAGDEAGFRGDLAAALRAGGDYVPALALQASLDHQEGRASRARTGWLRVLELEPDYPEALRGLAEDSLRRERYDEALPLLRRLVSKQPEDPSARLNLGLAALKKGRTEEAREHLARFLELAPNDPQAPAVRQALASLP